MGTYDTRGGSPLSDPAFDQSEICEGCIKTASECSCPDEKAPTPAQLRYLMAASRRGEKGISAKGARNDVFLRCLVNKWIDCRKSACGFHWRYHLTDRGRAHLPPNAGYPTK